MGRKALYREWRPRTFDEVVEQHHVVATLRQAVRTGRIAHAYLFSGTRGTGKTTMAQILSRAINCLDPKDGNPCNACEICTGILDGTILDVIEMDAASNNSVETIRRITDEVVFSPTRAKYKVYIVDEAHMLSTGAFNALLKTLEEPPAFAVFILATTEPHRIPPTILSRCQRYDFRRIPAEGIVGRLKEIAQDAGVPVDEDAYLAIASLADGAMRDAISLLDQCLSSAPERVTKDAVLELAGIVNDAFMAEMAEAVAGGDAAGALRLVDRLVMDGRDVVRFASDLAAHFRNVMVCKASPDPESLVRLPDAALARMKALAARMEMGDVIATLRSLSAMISDLKWAPDPRTAFEVGLIRLMPQAALPRPTEQAAVAATAAPTPAPATATAASASAPAVEAPAPAPEARPTPDPASVAPPAAPAAPASTPAPTPAPAATPAPAPAPAPADDAAAVWNRTLRCLQDNGQMGLYLFVRSGAPRREGGRLIVRLPADAVGHRAELERRETQKAMRAALQASGCLEEFAFEYAGETAAAAPGGAGAASAAPAEEHWTEKARRAAQENGIPFRMEE